MLLTDTFFYNIYIGIPMKCKQCNKLISNNKIYCNDLCESRYQSRTPRYCVICNSFIGTFASDVIKKTCSNACRGVLKQKQHQVENICAQCGKKFYTSASRKKKLCSAECRHTYMSSSAHVQWRTNLSKTALLDKYGDYYILTDEFAQKSRATKLKRYNNETFVNPEKMKQTKLLRYANENYNNHPQMIATLNKKYNIDNYNQTEDFRRKLYEKVISRISPYCIPNFTFSDYSGVSDEKYSFTCKVCYNVFNDSIDNGKFPLCTICNSMKKEELEIYDYIKTITGEEIITRTRDVISPLELDIYIPSKKIAIELNGIFWHSENKGKSRQYHLNKTKLCNTLGIELIHIYDHEWKTRTDIIKSILQNKISPARNKKIYARNCHIKELDSAHCAEFLSDNHVQGTANASVRLGLFHNDILVQVLTFSKSRFSKKYEYEMVRFCSKKYHTVIGGLSKLFKYFVKLKTPSSIVTFADRRFFTGNSYTSIGFEFDSHTLPNYYYFITPSKLESRINYQKHKLKNILPTFNENLSEWENMKNNRYDRIWDCGNSKFVWKTKDPLV